MKAPKCCGDPMVSYVTEVDGRYIKLWRCEECEREKKLYRWPWTWFWFRVSRNDLHDEITHKRLWLGHVASLFEWHDGTMTFTVMPLNVIIDVVVNTFKWLRHRQPKKWQEELAAQYSNGKAQGRSEERVRTSVMLRQLELSPQCKPCEFYIFKDAVEANTKRVDELVVMDLEAKDVSLRKVQIGQ